MSYTETFKNILITTTPQVVLTNIEGRVRFRLQNLSTTNTIYFKFGSLLVSDITNNTFHGELVPREWNEWAGTYHQIEAATIAYTPQGGGSDIVTARLIVWGQHII